jgi:hypothetical protein
VQLVRDRLLADPSLTGHEHELQRAVRHDPVEGSEQSVYLAHSHPYILSGISKRAGASFLSRPSEPGFPDTHISSSHWLGPWSVMHAALEGGTATSRPANLEVCGGGVLLSCVPA